MSFTTEIAKAVASANSVNRAGLNTALTDFRTSMATEFTTYGLKTPEKNWFDEQVYELGRELAASMRTRAGTVGGSILSEAGDPLADETNNKALLLES